MLFLFNKLQNNSGIYSHQERFLKVSVTPSFLEDVSQPELNNYIWAYTIFIENLGEQSVQLISRHWQVIDGKGRIENIIGPGVLGPGVQGQQPLIKPKEIFEYANEAHLTTCSGIIRGRCVFQILGQHSENFSVEVPAFSLDSPYQVRALQ